MSTLWVSEMFVNSTRGYRWGDDEPYETWYTEVGQLFRAMQKEYGRCQGKVYLERRNGADAQVGWVFEKIERYTDTHEPYLQEVWVTVYDEPPTVKTTYHYHEF